MICELFFTCLPFWYYYSVRKIGNNNFFSFQFRSVQWAYPVTWPFFPYESLTLNTILVYSKICNYYFLVDCLLITSNIPFEWLLFLGFPNWLLHFHFDPSTVKALPTAMVILGKCKSSHVWTAQHFQWLFYFLKMKLSVLTLAYTTL